MGVNNIIEYIVIRNNLIKDSKIIRNIIYSLYKYIVLDCIEMIQSNNPRSMRGFLYEY